MKKPHVEIILPVYNETENLSLLFIKLEEIKNILISEAQISFLIINDGSNEETNKIITSIYKSRDDVRVIELIHNFGHSAALTCGIDFFDADAAVIMDADLQDDPKLIPEMFKKWKSGMKTIVAERTSRKEKGRLFFKLFYYLFHKFNRSLPPIDFGTFCFLDRTIIERIRGYSERNRYFPGLVSLSSNTVVSLPFQRNARNSGKSKVGVWGLINLALTAILSFSTIPIRIVSVVGIVFAFFGFIVGLWVLYQKLFTTYAITGWASTVTSISFIGGLQLICLGVIGEYIARIYEETKKRPPYIVEKVRSLKKEEKAA